MENKVSPIKVSEKVLITDVGKELDYLQILENRFKRSKFAKVKHQINMTKDYLVQSFLNCFITELFISPLLQNIITV